MKSGAAAGLNSVEISNTFPHSPAAQCSNHPHFKAAPQVQMGFYPFCTDLEVQRLSWRVSTCHQAALDHSICPEMSETPGQTSGHGPISQPEFANPAQILQLQVPSSAQIHICSTRPLPHTSSQWHILFPQDHIEGQEIKNNTSLQTTK